MKCRTLLLLTAVLFTIQAQAPQASDSKHLQGTWKVVSAHDSGRVTPIELIKDLRMVICEDRITYRLEKKTITWFYKLDSNNRPKWIDLTEGNEVMLGIYELEGDNLKICYPEAGNGKRSTAFESKQGSVNDVLIILKRDQR